MIATRPADNGGHINVEFCQDLDPWLESAISGHSRAIGNSRNALDSIFLHYLYSASCLGRGNNSKDWLLFRSTANLATVIIQEHFAARLRLLNYQGGIERGLLS